MNSGAAPNRDMPTVRRCRTSAGNEVCWSSSGNRRPAVLVVGGWLTNVALDWVNGPCSRFHRQLAAQRRLIRFDLPGSGMSPAAPAGLALSTALDAAEAVARASGETRVAVLSYGFGTQVAIGLAARRPDLVSHLVLMSNGSTPPQRQHEEVVLDATASLLRASWRLGAMAMSGVLAPAAGAEHAEWYADHQQMCASQEGSSRLLAGLRALDASACVPKVAAPTLMLLPPAEGLRPRSAQPWPGARQTELPVHDMLPFFGARDRVVDAVCSFTAAAGASQLTAREQAVLRELAFGHSNRGVAVRLGIAENTVAKHASNLFRKLRVDSRCAAVLRGQQLGLLNLADDASDPEPLCRTGT